MERDCKKCGRRYSRPPSQIGEYCSRECAYADRRAERTKHRRMRYEPSHPLAGKTGLVGEARAILFGRIGHGPHPCHWCGKMVGWQIGVRGQPPDALVADHVDSDALNDAPENLVPACGACNATRGRPKKFEVVELACESCGTAVQAAYKRTPPIICRNCKRSKKRRTRVLVPAEHCPTCTCMERAA